MRLKIRSSLSNVFSISGVTGQGPTIDIGQIGVLIVDFIQTSSLKYFPIGVILLLIIVLNF